MRCSECQPDEIYNLAAQSFVQTSWTQPVLTGEFTALGRDAHARGDEEGGARRRASIRPARARCSARSSRRRSASRRRSIREARTAWPRCTAHWITVNYRESFGLYAVSGILFNHESPRRGLEFVTRKVTDAAARIKLGLATRGSARQPRRAPRLGLCRRLRRRDVAHAPAGRAATTT